MTNMFIIAGTACGIVVLIIGVTMLLCWYVGRAYNPFDGCDCSDCNE